jgi:hypothetical protein
MLILILRKKLFKAIVLPKVYLLYLIADKKARADRQKPESGGIIAVLHFSHIFHYNKLDTSETMGYNFIVSPDG